MKILRNIIKILLELSTFSLLLSEGLIDYTESYAQPRAKSLK